MKTIRWLFHQITRPITGRTLIAVVAAVALSFTVSSNVGQTTRKAAPAATAIPHAKTISLVSGTSQGCSLAVWGWSCYITVQPASTRSVNNYLAVHSDDIRGAIAAVMTIECSAGGAAAVAVCVWMGESQVSTTVHNVQVASYEQRCVEFNYDKLWSGQPFNLSDHVAGGAGWVGIDTPYNGQIEDVAWWSSLGSCKVDLSYGSPYQVHCPPPWSPSIPSCKDV
jgi:hypothetical protein